MLSLLSIRSSSLHGTCRSLLRMEVVFLREPPLCELSEYCCGRQPSEHRARHPVGLWFSGFAACGSNFFVGVRGSKIFKGHSKWQLEEERESKLRSCAQEADSGRWRTRGLISRKFWYKFFTRALLMEGSKQQILVFGVLLHLWKHARIWG